MAVFIMRGSFNELLPDNSPVITAISPATAARGQTVALAITGRNTGFSTTGLRAGPGITVSWMSVQTAFAMQAMITIAPDAAPGPRSIAAGSGSQEATLPNGFIVQ